MDSNLINIYCDESCHLPNDESNVMVLGALSCPENKKNNIYKEIRQIKARYLADSKIEIKWSKVSTSKFKLFDELIRYFFSNKNLKYRAVIAKNKSKLNHGIFNQNDYDLWYYKMYYLLLDKICYPDRTYKIFIDIKDTKGGPRVRKLHDVLCNNIYDFKKDIILDVNQVNSNRSDLLQVADILTGAISYYHRGLYYEDSKSNAKKSIIDIIIEHKGEESLKYGTSLGEDKFNTFIWYPKVVDNNEK